MPEIPPSQRSRRPALHHPVIPYKERPRLGIAGNVARVFINSPLSPLLMFVTLSLGLLGLIYTPRQEDPQISVPMIDIFIRYPGASSEQVASLAIDPLERIMSEIPGVKHIYSASQREQGLVTVRFIVGEELGPSIVKVHDKLQSNLDKIPPGVSMPLVKPKGIDDVPIVTFTLWSLEEDDWMLRTLAHDVLQRLKEVPDTGQGFVVGGRSDQIRIEVLPERLSGYGISLDQVADTIRAANTEENVGSLEFGDNAFKVKSGSYLSTPEDVAWLVLAIRNGIPIYVRDVARVFQGPEETQRMVLYSSGPAHDGSTPEAEGAPAVTIAIAKKEGTNGVTVSKDLLRKVESLKGRLIPENVYVTTTRNYGKTATDKVNELLAAMFEAAIAVSILCWITLGPRPAIVVITVIPLTILITIWTAWVFGYSIDRVSLFALIFSIGILVDDATVVVENIYRRWLLENETSIETAIDAVREVGNPTIMANLTIFAALLPMATVSGMMGPYMLPIPILGTAAAFFSVVFAFMFTPWFSYALRPKMKVLQKSERRERKTQEIIGRLYRPLIVPFIKHRPLAWVLLIGIIIVFFLTCSMFYTKAVTVKMLPFDNKPEFNVIIDMPEGTALPITANVTRRLAEEILKVPEVTALQSYVGTVSPFNFNGMVRHYYLRGEVWHADIMVMLMEKHDRDRSSHEIASAVRQKLTPIAQQLGSRIQVVEMPPGPPVLQTVVAEVYGPDAETRRKVSDDITGIFEQVPNLVDVDNYMAQPHEIYHFKVNTEKAVRRGISVETINRSLSMAMGGHQLGDVKRGNVLEPTYLVIQVPLETRSQIDRLVNLPIPMPEGGTVPLSELGYFEKVLEDPIIYHKDLRPMEYIIGEMEGRLGAPIYGMLGVEEQLENYETPDQTYMSGTLTAAPEDEGKSSFEWAGEWTVTYETFRDLGLAFAGALVLIYIILVWEFGNFIHPLIVMAPIPLTLIGIIPGHWILNAEFTATSMIGFIALAGIEVRNSILMVDFAKNEVHRGQTVKDAVVEAGRIRFRPIWVTDLTMMAGAAAILFDPIFQGMAISLLFGPVIATSLTLLVVPLGCVTASRALCPPSSEFEDEVSEVCPLPVEPRQVVLEPEVAKVFPDPAAVDDAACPVSHSVEQKSLRKSGQKS